MTVKELKVFFADLPDDMEVKYPVSDVFDDGGCSCSMTEYVPVTAVEFYEDWVSGAELSVKKFCLLS